MKIWIKRIIKASALVLSCTMLMGCWNRVEMNMISVVLGVGFDQDDSQQEMISMTLQIANLTGESSYSGGMASGDAKPFTNLTGKGKNTIEIMRDFTHVTSRKLYLPHSQVLIFGQGLAQVGVWNELELFIRNQETRLSVLVFVSKEKAKQVLDVSSNMESMPSALLNKIAKNNQYTSEIVNVRIFDFLKALLTESQCPVAPLIEIIEDGKDEQQLIIKETAVFKGENMIGTLDSIQTRGYLWMTNGIGSGIIPADLPDGSVSFEIVNAQCKSQVDILEDNAVKIRLEIEMESNIASQNGSLDLSTGEATQMLEALQQQAIQREITSCIERTKALRADIYGFGELIHKYHPERWNEMKDNWEEHFTNIQYDIQIQSKVRHSGGIIKPPKAQEAD